MVMLGGATRLTHAGLSIVEWKPITGIIPPLNMNHWLMEFQKYQKTPEFIQINSAMTLSDFQFIYWMEYAHRLLGRIIGLCFFLPLIFLWKTLSSFLRQRSIMILLLIGLQGFLGWYMVKSGLVQEPSVSHYRLTIHLITAFILMGLLINTILPFITNEEKYTKKMHLAKLSFAFICLTIIYGGFVAGLKAGLIYNTFPLMGGQWIPSEFFHLSPFYKNFVQNHATVQWLHRVFGLLSLLHVFLFYRYEKNIYTKIWFGLLCTQVIIGIVTLVHHVSVLLGTLHQGIGALVFSWSIVILTIYKKEEHVLSASKARLD